MLPSVYTPVELSSQLAAGMAQVLPWVGAGVGGGITLMFVFLGIRAGFRFFSQVVQEKRFKNSEYGAGEVSDAVWNLMSDDQKDAEMDRSARAGTW